ncbi:MAG: hypothetical protein IJ129_04560 [Ruminococcus sp.]|nr:hypothetical protein [Ruminococcus sp.]
MATSKKAAEVAAEVKEEAKVVADKAKKATTKAAAKTKETAAKAATKAKATATKAKATAAKAVEKDSVVIEYADKQVDIAAVVEAAKADYKAKGHRAPKAVTVYVKPEEGVAYYTVAGKGSDDQKVDL